MPSFDVVSEIDLQEVDNAVNQAAKEVAQRFDFRGTHSEISFDKKTLLIKLVSNSEEKMATIVDILQSKVHRRGLQIEALKVGKNEPIGGMLLKCEITLQQGIDRDTAKEITKIIKESKMKVQASIQDDKIRVTGKKRDDLQAAMNLLRSQKLEVPLQFNNFRD